MRIQGIEWSFNVQRGQAFAYFLFTSHARPRINFWKVTKKHTIGTEGKYKETHTQANVCPMQEQMFVQRNRLGQL